MNEIYRLRLDHFMDMGNGERHQLDEPLIVQIILDRRYMPQAICLNKMMDMMKDELLRKIGE